MSPPETAATMDSLSSVLEDAIRTAPLGCGNDRDKPPFSPSQMLVYINKQAQSAKSTRSATPEALPALCARLNAMVADTVIELERWTRAEIMECLNAITHAPAPDLPPALLDILSARYGPAELQLSLDEAPRFVGTTARTCFSVLARLATRCSYWKVLLRGAEADSWTDLAQRAPRPTTIPSGLVHAIDIQSTTAKRRMLSIGRPERFWLVRLRLTATASDTPTHAQISVRRITIAEDVSKHVRLEQNSSPDAVCHRVSLVGIASRDVNLEPPVALNSPGSFVDVRLHLPRVAGEADPPSLRIVEIV